MESRDRKMALAKGQGVSRSFLEVEEPSKEGETPQPAVSTTATTTTTSVAPTNSARTRASISEDVKAMKERHRNGGGSGGDKRATQPGAVQVAPKQEQPRRSTTTTILNGGGGADIQAMKNRARRSSTGAVKPGVMPVSAATTITTPTTAGRNLSPSISEQLQQLDPEFDATVDAVLSEKEMMLLSKPGAHHTDEDEQEKGRRASTWVDPLQQSGFCTMAEQSFSNLDPYTQYSANPSFERATSSVAPLPEHSEYSGVPDVMGNTSAASSLPSESENLNAPVQHFAVWKEEEEQKSSWNTGWEFNRTLFTVGLIVVSLLIIGTIVGVSLGVTLGKKSPDMLTSPTESPPTLAPAIVSPDCVSATQGQTSQSQRFLELSNILGTSAQDSAQRKAICWLADSDLLQLDPTLQQAKLEERYALAVFYFSTTTESPGAMEFTNWMSDEDECSWLGITCDSSGIVKFELSQGQALVGMIPSEISRLSRLSAFSLFNNADLTGPIPEALYQISTLTSLSLDANALNGTISSSIGNLPQLSIVSIGKNNLVGSLPIQLFALTNLTQLVIAENSFTGSIPSSIGQLSKLNSNSLTGTVPSELGLCTALEVLGVSNNRALQGNIPTELGYLTVLSALTMEFTNLTGTMPSQICSLRNLQLQRLESDCARAKVTCESPTCCTDCF